MKSIKKIIKFSIYAFIYLSIHIFSFFSKKKIFFFIYNQSEIGSIMNCDNFIRMIAFEIRDHNIYAIKKGPIVINRYLYKKLNKKFLENKIKSFNSNLFNYLLHFLFLRKNKFILDVPPRISYSNYTKLKKNKWIDDEKKEMDFLYEKLQIEKNSWFVGFFSRDALFDSNYRFNMAKEFSNRNSNIEDFIPAMKFISDNGGYAVRIGNQQNKKLNVHYPRIIDYPFLEEKSEKLDFLITYFPKFIIGCGSGIVDLSSLNNVPTGYVNLEQYEHHIVRKNAVFIPKIIKYKKNDKILSKTEYFKIIKNHSTIQDLNKLVNHHNLYYEDNSPEDILNITKDFYNKFIQAKSVESLNFKIKVNKRGLNIFKPFYEKYLT